MSYPGQPGVPGSLVLAAELAEDHLATCPSCSAGVACPAGDEVFEVEARAYGDWLGYDQPAATAYMRAGWPS